MIFTIEWWENKTSAKGNAYAVTSLKAQDGTMTDATIFSSFPNFANLKAGETIEGELKSQEYNGKTSYTLEPIKVAPTAPTGGNRGGFIAKAQEVKEKSIEKAQTHKELGIKIASTMSMACQTALAFLQGEQIKDVGIFKEQVKQWRKFYWENWDAEERDFNPFPSN